MATRTKGLFKPVPRRNDMEPSMYKEIGSYLSVISKFKIFKLNKINF